MDKIFKNDTIMGIVAIVTLALVGIIYYKQYHENDKELPLGSSKPAVI